MQQNSIGTIEAPQRRIDTRSYIMKRPFRYTIRTLEREAMEVLDTVEMPAIVEGAVEVPAKTERVDTSNSELSIGSVSDGIQDALLEATSIEAPDTVQISSVVETPAIETIDTIKTCSVA